MIRIYLLSRNTNFLYNVHNIQLRITWSTLNHRSSVFRRWHLYNLSWWIPEALRFNSAITENFNSVPNISTDQLRFTGVRKITKSDCQHRNVCLSVCMSVCTISELSNAFPLDGFSWNFVVYYLKKKERSRKLKFHYNLKKKIAGTLREGRYTLLITCRSVFLTQW